MTRIIKHRINTRELLAATDKRFGVEIDIRSLDNHLIIQHDPFTDGELLEDWLSLYDHGTLILNIKEEGLEEALIQLMQKYQIHDYFFLDQSFPFLIKWSKKGERRCAVRVSEFESIETAINLAGKIDWVWVDCFSHFPLTTAEANRLKQANFKLCLVSPELQGRDPFIEIPQLHEQLTDRCITADAICTKYPELWNELIPA